MERCSRSYENALLSRCIKKNIIHEIFFGGKLEHLAPHPPLDTPERSGRYRVRIGMVTGQKVGKR